MAAHFAIHYRSITVGDILITSNIYVWTLFSKTIKPCHILFIVEIYIYGPWSDKTGLNDITTLRHNIGFYTNVTNGLYFRCSVLDFLCNLRFNYKDPWLNSDYILKFESDLRVKITCLNFSGQSRWTPSVVYLFRSKYIDFKYLVIKYLWI